MQLTPEMLNSTPFRYAEDVRNGKIITGHRIKQAVERFYKWIQTAKTNNEYYINHNHGMHVIEFFPKFLNHTKGKGIAGKPFELTPFQQFTLYNLFGWKNKEGLRRIRKVYDKRAKKNGKTAEMAGIALYVMAFDGEMGAEVYIGATKEEQAKLCFDQAAQFIDSPVSNRALGKMGFLVQQNKILFKKTGSKLRPLGGDSKTQDGINAHLAIIDEYHAHPTDGVKNNLESSSVMRSQPITYHITTAGTNIGSVCKMYEDDMIKVLDGYVDDDHTWIMIHDLDEGDDWNNPDCWIKANPLLGNGLSIDGIMVEYKQTLVSPSKIPNFKTKNLNMWVDAASVWIMRETFEKNLLKNQSIKKYTKIKEIPLSIFRELGCYAGLDLSSTTDLTALTLLSNPDKNGKQYVKMFLFCPKDNIEQRSKADKVPYRAWRDKGYIIATPGARVDLDYMFDFICKIYQETQFNRVDADPWNALHLLNKLENSSVPYSALSQVMSVLSYPTKTVEADINEGKYLFEDNPIIPWMLSSVQTIEDSKGNIMIHKGKSHKGGKRIDGWAALINAKACQLQPEEESNESIYNNPDEEFIC